MRRNLMWAVRRALGPPLRWLRWWANPSALARKDPFAATQRLAAAYGLKARGPSS